MVIITVEVLLMINMTVGMLIMINSCADALRDAARLLGDERPAELFLCRARHGRIETCELYVYVSRPTRQGDTERL